MGGRAAMATSRQNFSQCGVLRQHLQLHQVLLGGGSGSGRMGARTAFLALVMISRLSTCRIDWCYQIQLPEGLDQSISNPKYQLYTPSGS